MIMGGLRCGSRRYDSDVMQEKRRGGVRGLQDFTDRQRRRGTGFGQDGTREGSRAGRQRTRGTSVTSTPEFMCQKGAVGNTSGPGTTQGRYGVVGTGKSQTVTTFQRMSNHPNCRTQDRNLVHKTHLSYIREHYRKFRLCLDMAS